MPESQKPERAPLMDGHLPYAPRFVFLCVGHSPASERSWRHAVNLEPAISLRAERALDGIWGRAAQRRLDGRVILPAGAISLERILGWLREIEEGPKAFETAGAALWPRRFFRRVWLAGGSLRSDWARASTRFQAIEHFHRNGPEGSILLMCEGRRALEAHARELTEISVGKKYAFYCGSEGELDAWFPPEFESLEAWMDDRRRKGDPWFWEEPSK